MLFFPMRMSGRPNCLRCRHFFVTWDTNHPKGCHAYGFKSAELPANAVFRSSGDHCQLFEEKPKPPGSAPPSSDRDEFT